MTTFYAGDVAHEPQTTDLPLTNVKTADPMQETTVLEIIANENQAISWTSILSSLLLLSKSLLKIPLERDDNEDDELMLISTIIYCQ